MRVESVQRQTPHSVILRMGDSALVSPLQRMHNWSTGAENVGNDVWTGA